MRSVHIECVASLSYHTCVRVVCVGKTNPTPPCARAHTDTSACSRARTHTRACAPHTDPLQSSRNKMRRHRPHAHKSNSVLLYYSSSIHTSAPHKYARAIRAHTHTHTQAHTHRLSLSHTHARGTGIQSARACIHREREPLLAEWEQACGTIHFLTRYFARRPHSPPVGTGLFPRHYSFTYNFIFTDTLPAESCGTCFSSYICFCFCCYTDTLQAARGLGAAALLSRRLLACAQRGGRETLRCI